jgi:hypothetical protein
MKSILANFIFLLIIQLGFSQGQTIKFLENNTSPPASLEEVSWIQGYWKGEAFGGITEEFWSPPLGDSMMFSFKLVVDNKVVFYELGGIRQVDKTLLLQLKHFGNDFKGWEEKDETVDFKLVKIEKNKAYFDQFTFEKISENEMNLYVVISENGLEEEVKFNYKKE